MNYFAYQFLSLDLPPLLTASFSALSCAILGNFLLLRRMSLMGDAISHAVLPGIVVAFLISGSRASLPVFIGAAITGILTTVLVELVSRLGRVERGAALGVVFSVLFAAGVLLMEQAAARSVDLDAECLLHGQLETIFWYPANQWSTFFSVSNLSALPSEVWVTLAVFLSSSFFVWLFFKELTLISFDSALADSLGYRSNLMHYCFMVVVACAVVASFKAVGSILVIAMLIAPAATARLLTDRLKVQIALSALLAISATILGYIFAAFAPQILGTPGALSASGMIAVALGAQLAMAVLLAPHYGVLRRASAIS